MSISTTPRQRRIAGTTILASDAEMRHMQAGIDAARFHTNRHGEFETIIDCEDVVCEAMHDSMAKTGDFAMIDDDTFYELSSFITMAWYAGDFGTQHGSI